jgi:hypothetical protein
VRFPSARLLASLVGLVVIVTVAPTASSSPIDLHAVSRSTTNLTATPRAWPMRLVSTADLEGPPVVVPGTDEAFALHGNDGEEVATEPLESVNLESGELDVGPRVPDDALVGVVGTRVVLVAPERYRANGVAMRPWRVWTVNPKTLQLERQVSLPFVSDFGAVIPTVDPGPGLGDIWVSDGTTLRLVNLVDGRVTRTIDIPALALTVDPTGHSLYALAAGSAHRSRTVVELDARTGSILASSVRWTSLSPMQIVASAVGVYLLDTGRAHQAVLFLGERGLRPVSLPVSLESALAATLENGDQVTTTPLSHGAVVGSAGRLTCVSQGASSIRASTALAPHGVSWNVFAQRGETLFAWDVPSNGESSRIEAIAAPSLC